MLYWMDYQICKGYGCSILKSVWCWQKQFTVSVLNNIELSPGEGFINTTL